jgi:hypothetical protein
MKNLNPHNIKVGDIVTCFYKGFWRVTAIERRFSTRHDAHVYGPVGTEYSPLVCVESVANSKMKPVSGKQDTCDISYCRPYTVESLAAERTLKIKEIEDGYTFLISQLK